MVDNKPGFLRWDGTQYIADPQNNIGPLGRTGGDLIGFYPSPITIKEVFVYRDSEPNPKGNIFSTFNAAYNARKLTKSQASIEIDDTLNPGNAQITPGIYDLTDTVLTGTESVPGLGTNLTCVGGNVTLQNLAGLKNVALKTNSTTTPNIVMGGSGFGSIYLYNSSLTSNGSAPLLLVQNNIVLYITLEAASNIINNGGSAINLTGTSTVAILAYSGSSVGNNSISGIAGTTLVAAPDASALIGTLSGFLGTLDNILLDKSPNVGYAPGTPGNWSPVPNNVSDALDQLSGETHALSGDVTGPTGSNTVIKIQGTPVSSASVANDGYALVSVGNVWTPTGIAPVFNVKNYGAVGNGVADDTFAIQRALAATLMVGGTLYFPPHTYKITGSFVITGACRIYMERGGLIIPALPDIPENQKVFNISASNVEIDGLNFDYTGRQDGYEGTRYMVWAAGINDSNHITDVIIKNCRFTNIMTGNFVPGQYINLDVAHAIFVTWVDECLIEKNFIQNVSGFGIFTEGCHFPTISNNELIDTGWASISAKSGGFGGLIENNRITGQTVGRRDEGGSIDIPATPSEGMGPNSRLVVRNNYISGFVQYGNACRVGSSSYVDVDSNVFDQVWGTNIAPTSGPTSVISFTTRGLQNDACHSIRVRGNVFIAAQASQLSNQGQIGIQVDNVLSGSGETNRGSDLIISNNMFISPDAVAQSFTMAIMVHGQNGGWDNVDIHDNIGDGYCIPTAVLPGFIWVGAGTSTLKNVSIHHNTLNNIGTNDGNQYGIVVGQNASGVTIDHNTIGSWNTPFLLTNIGNSDIIFEDDFYGAPRVNDYGDQPLDFKHLGARTMRLGTDGTILIDDLTANQAVITNSSKQLSSLGYATTATANTLAERDSSGNLAAVGMLPSYIDFGGGSATTGLIRTSDTTNVWEYNSSAANYIGAAVSAGVPSFGNASFTTTINSSNGGIFLNVGGVNRFVVTSGLTFFYSPIIGNGVPLRLQSLTKILPSDADYTFTSGEYSNPILTVEGTISTTRNMMLPNVQGAIYFVKNATTGGQSLVFLVIGQTGVTVTNGKRAIIICNGSDYEVYAAVTQNVKSISNANSPYTVLSTDNIIATNSTLGAITINLPVSPLLGDTYQIKDSVGQAATNNINIIGNGHNIDGAASFVISTNYSSITIAFTGTVWSIL